MKKKVSGVPVLNDKNELTGFISDGDIIRHLASEQSVFVNPDSIEKIGFNIALLDLIKQNVASIAKKKVITVSAEDDLDPDLLYTVEKSFKEGTRHAGRRNDRYYKCQQYHQICGQSS